MFGSPYKTSNRTITGTITPVGHAPYRNRGRNRRRGFLHDRGEPPGSAALAALKRKRRVASGESTLFGEGLLYRHGERCTIVPDVSWFHTLFTHSQLRRLESPAFGCGPSPSSAWVFNRPMTIGVWH